MTPRPSRQPCVLFAVLCVLLSVIPGGCQEPAAPGPEVSPEPTDPAGPHWSRFRGPDGLGVCPFPDIPQDWDCPSGRNVLWSTPIPLTGAASPVLWANRLYLAGADEQTREVYCLDADSGGILWRHQVGEPTTPPKLHPETGHAPSTAVTDGRHVAAIFPTGDLACYAADGRPLWRHRYDLSQSRWGYGSSPIIHGDVLIVQLDQGGPEDGLSRILALDLITGETIWETPRPVAASWTTPIVIDTGQRPELITSAKPWVIAYDPDTGRELWRVRCVEGDSAPSPIYAAGLILVANIYAELTAIRPGGAGDVTDSHVAWSVRGRLPDICSPLSDGERVYVLTTQGFLSCYSLADGALLWTHDFRTRFSSSPALVEDRVYLLAEEGTTIVLRAAPEFAELGRYATGEFCHASFAFSPGRVYIRGRDHLFCIGAR